ncbi:MAG: hypothetical protein M3150_10055 [Pseudomonadota bacterium]|nr:hypothetical protein [Pseudomonadota bacterium]
MKIGTIALAAVLALGGSAFAATGSKASSASSAAGSHSSTTRHAAGKSMKHHASGMRHASRHQRDAITTTTSGAGAEAVGSTSREARMDQALQKFRSHS